MGFVVCMSKLLPSLSGSYLIHLTIAHMCCIAEMLLQNFFTHISALGKKPKLGAQQGLPKKFHRHG